MTGPVTRQAVAAVTAILLSGVGGCAASTPSPAPAPAPARSVAEAAPVFRYETDWMKVPTQWAVGDISAVAVDSADHVWILHRPRSLAPELRSRAAPPVMEFDSEGNFLRAWGGEGAVYDWPANEHSLFVDARNRVWISGNSRADGAGDDAILAFTADGAFLRQIGRENGSGGDQDTANVDAAADLYVDADRHDLYVADGYGNRRVIVFDSETGAFKRMWGAYGARPPVDAGQTPAPAPSRAQGDGAAVFGSVHGVELSRDGLVYVSDRASQRVQVFDRDGHYKAQVFVDRDLPSPQTASGLALSADPTQRWLFVVDFGNSRIVAFNRKTLTQVATYGGQGAEPGQFQAPHLMATDSRGVLYVAEVRGHRVQRLTPQPALETRR
jgi:hypothetical protein